VSVLVSMACLVLGLPVVVLAHGHAGGSSVREHISRNAASPAPVRQPLRGAAAPQPLRGVEAQEAVEPPLGGDLAAQTPLWCADVPVPVPESDTWDGALAELKSACAESPPVPTWLVAGPFRDGAAAAGPPAPPRIDRLAEGGDVTFRGTSRPLRRLQAAAAGRVRFTARLRQGGVMVAACEFRADEAGAAGSSLSAGAAGSSLSAGAAGSSLSAGAAGSSLPAGPARLFFSGDASVIAWVNGRLVTDVSGSPLYLHAHPDSDCVDVTLRKGRNTLLLVVERTSRRRWWFAARVGRHRRDRVRIKMLVTLAEHVGERFPESAARALVTAAEHLMARPESEDEFAAALLNRVLTGRSAPVRTRRSARRLLIRYYRRVGAVREEVRALEEAVADLQTVALGVGHIPPESDAHAGLLFALANAQFRAGRFAEAVATYERLVGLFQSGRYALDALVAIAERYRRMGLRERVQPICTSILDLTRALDLDQGDRRRATAQAILDWSQARWTDRPHLERDFEAERLIQRADDLAKGAGREPHAGLAAALDLYGQAADRGAAAVIPRPDGRIVGVRAYCHARIRDLLEAGDRAENARLYERRVGASARELLRRAGTAGSSSSAEPLAEANVAGETSLRRARLLRTVASRFPFSPSAEVALNRLGDDALTSGRFSEAALCFGRLLTCRGWTGGLARRPPLGRLAAKPADVAQPPSAAVLRQPGAAAPHPLPAVTAKAAFCAARLSPADAHWVRLDGVTPSGLRLSVAGHSFALPSTDGDGRARLPERWFRVRTPSSPVGRSWPTFGGDAGRAGWMEGRREPGPNVVTVPFADSAGSQVARVQAWPNIGPGPFGQRLSHNVAVVGGADADVQPPGWLLSTGGARAFFHTDRMAYAVDLGDGGVAWRFGRWWGPGPVGPAGNRWGSSQAFFTTVAEGRVFARLRVPRRSADDRRRWALYAVAADDGRLVWSTEARRLLPHDDGPAVPGNAGEEVVSEPAYAHGHVYAIVRSAGDFPNHTLVALRADSGQVVWRTVLCSGPGTLRVFLAWPASPTRRDRPAGRYAAGDVCPPPTIAGDTVVVVTNLGFVFALDALTGETRWAFRYERSFLADGRSDEMRRLVNRDVVPAAVRGDCVVVCPRDTQAVFALDLATGRLRWRLDLHDVQRIIGCDAEHVYLDGEALLCVHLATGTIRWRSVAGEDPSVGSGVLVGRRLLAPTEERLVRRSTYRDRVAGSTAWPAAVGPVGNLVLVGNHLLGFGRAGLTVFSHEATPEFARRSRSRAALAGAEAAADEGNWPEARRLASAVASAAADPDSTARADLVEARAAFAAGDRAKAAATVKGLLSRHAHRLIRLPCRWVSPAALVEEYLPTLPMSARPGRSPAAEWGTHLGLEAVVPADEPRVAWPSDGAPTRFIVVSGRWVECRLLAEPYRTHWRVQMPFEPTHVLWTAGRVVLWSSWEVAALSGRSGRLLWRHVLGRAAAAGRPPYAISRVLADASVVAAASREQVVVLDAATGRPLWTMPLVAYRLHRPVAVADGRVYVVGRGSERTTLSALDARAGMRAWEMPVGPPDDRLVCLHDGRVLWCASGVARTVTKIELRSGRILATTTMPAAWGKGVFHGLRRVGVPAHVGAGDANSTGAVSPGTSPPAPASRPLRGVLLALWNTGATWRGGEAFWRLAFTADRVKPLLRVRGTLPFADCDGRTLVLGGGAPPAEGGGATLSAWDVRTGEKRWVVTLKPGERVLAMTRRPDDLEAVIGATAGEDRGTLWRVRWRLTADGAAAAGRQRLAGRPARLPGPTAVPICRWLRDGLVCAAGDGVYVYRWRDAPGPARPEAALEAALAAPARSAVPAGGLVAAAAYRARDGHVCAPVSRPIVVDGCLDDWRGVPAFSLDSRRQTRRLRAVQPEDDTPGWTGPRDLSVSVRAAYDEEHLYLAVEVTDDVHRPAGPGAALWRGDAVEVVLQGDDSRLPVPDGRTVHLAAACRDGRTVLRVLRGSVGVAGVRCAVRRREGAAVYEWAFAWAALGRASGARGALEAGSAGRAARIGLGLLVSDDDGEGVKGGLEFGAGIAGGVVPDLLGSVRLQRSAVNPQR